MRAPLPLLEADRLVKRFPGQPAGSPPALADVTLRLHEGEILAIVGANGAGKTTLVDVLATVVQPDAGTLTIAGHDSRRDPAAVRRRIGYLPSGGRSLYPRLTGTQNLRFFAALHGICGTEADARVTAVLRLCGASEAAETRADRLSDGASARVALARALLHDPAVLLLDEPTRSIDPVHRPMVLRAIRTFAAQPGKAAVFVTHNLEDVFAIATRVAVLDAGVLVHDAAVAGTSDARGILDRVLGARAR